MTSQSCIWKIVVNRFRAYEYKLGAKPTAETLWSVLTTDCPTKGSLFMKEASPLQALIVLGDFSNLTSNGKRAKQAVNNPADSSTVS